VRLIRTSLITAGLLGSIAAPLLAQAASERATLRQTISGTVVEIDYARPSVRGRDLIFGGQVHWGEIWTPGARDATVLSVSEDFAIAGVDVAAGAYSVWLELIENGDWQLMLHPDTSLFHTDHPPLEEGTVVVPVQPRPTDGFVETLAFDIQHIRADGGHLIMRWADTEVSVPLGIDPGYVLSVTPEVAAQFTGTWMHDRSAAAPSAEEIEEIRAEIPDGQSAGFEAYLESLMTPVPLEIFQHPESGQLWIRYPDEPADAEYQMILVPRAEGIFTLGFLWRGELSELWDASFWEFEMDDSGIAAYFDERNSETDALESRGARPGGD